MAYYQCTNYVCASVKIFQHLEEVSIPKFLNHTQSKDNKSIHPPLQITNLILSIQECNPDKDIQVHQPTIQIQESEATIYDQRGNYMATITIEKLQWLWNQFSYHQSNQLANSLQPSTPKL